MKVSDLFKLAAFGLLAGLAACSSEVLQGGPPEREPDLADGETAVRMNIGGLGGSVTTRAGSSVVLAGEMDIKKLEVYCFVDLTAETSSGSAWQPDDYSLERVYTYNTLSSGNNMFLIPLGAGYQAVFGVPVDDRQRIFVLVANDIPRTGIKGLRIAEAGEGQDRSGTITYGGIKQLKIRETALQASDVIATPLPMKGIAQRKIDNSLTYSKYDLENGIEVTLRRAVARIDIRNLVSTKFTINKIAIKGVKNSLLFAEAGSLPMAGSTDYELVGFDEKPVTDTNELLAGAFYAYPVQGDGAHLPEVTITGSFGSGGDVSVKATFDGAASNPGALNPNTRYMINLLNSANNLIATLSIADWEQGEQMDTEDVATSLNAGATITLDAGQNIWNSSFRDNTFYFYCGYSFNPMPSDENRIATIEGADGDKKSIGIILPAVTDLKVKDLGTTGTNGARKYSLHYGTYVGGSIRPADKEQFSVLTYDPVTKEQVTSEYVVYKDQVNVTTLAENYDYFMVFGDSYTNSNGIQEKYYLSPFGVECAIVSEVDLQQQGIQTVLDVIIPENCSWLYKRSTADVPGGTYTGIGVAENLGGTERRATIEVRRYDRTSPTLFETKKVTIIQPQGRTIASSLLSDGYKIELDPEEVAAGTIKLDGNKIKIAMDGLSQSLFSIISNQFPSMGSSSYAFKFLLFETSATWLRTYRNGFDYARGQSLAPTQYRLNLNISDIPPLNQPGKFTITYCDADGNRMTDTYEIEVVAGATVN